MKLGQTCGLCRGSCSLIPGRGCFDDLPGDEIVVFPPSLIVEPLYGMKFGVVFLAEGPRTASMQKGFDCFGLYHPGLERERDFWLAVELP